MSAVCGTLTTTESGGISGWYTPTTTSWPYSTTYYWPYTTDPRVAVLEAKVETLEKMLAAVIAGGKAPALSRKRAR